MPLILPWKFIYKKRFDSYDKFKDYVSTDLNCLVSKNQSTNCTKCSQYATSKHKMKYIMLVCDAPDCNMVELCNVRYRVKVCDNSTNYEFERLNEHDETKKVTENANLRRRHGKK